MPAIQLPITYELNVSGPFTDLVDGDSFHAPSPFTSHTVQIDFTRPLARIVHATWRLIWSAKPGTIVRLYSLSPDRSAPVVPLAYFNSCHMLNPMTTDQTISDAASYNISNDATDLTAAHEPASCDYGQCVLSLVDLQARGLYQEIAFDVSGDNTNPVRIFTSRLEIVWEFDVE